jgi:phosphoribosylaminoimidazole carboxylase
MMALEAPRLNINMKFLDGTGDACPAAQVIGATAGNGGDARIVKGALYDADKLAELAKGCDVVTMEIEHVGVDGLAGLEKEGVNVQPSSRVIGIIQDKFAQKVGLNDDDQLPVLTS